MVKIGITIPTKIVPIKALTKIYNILVKQLVGKPY